MERVDLGLALRPFRALRPAADGDRLARLLCPPFDVIDQAERDRLLGIDPDNAVSVILPEPAGTAAAYQAAAKRLSNWVASGRWLVDDVPALYVYELATPGGSLTRGLLGALELRDPADGIVLPHENTMAGPVADRLALMRATEADLEPIYLVYEGGGTASEVVDDVSRRSPVARATTADGVTHRLWRLPDPEMHAAVAADLAPRRALIADGHHRYATYRELQREMDAQRGPGPWDRGLTLLVDTSSYGPQVHAIHRVLPTLALADAVDRVARHGARVVEVADAATGLRQAVGAAGFAAVLSDGRRSALIADESGALRAAAVRAGEPGALADLDVTVLHRGLVERVWDLADNEENVAYAHDLDDAVAAARASGGTAVALRATPVTAVAAVAAAGARMPRKSTSFMPKPASGLVMRRFVDEH
jgi:uncharacterized protein (DUF1015 family)